MFKKRQIKISVLIFYFICLKISYCESGPYISKIMEFLHDKLQPYKELVGSAASIVTIAQFFSGAFVCRDIYQQKSTRGIDSTPFIGGTCIGLLMLKYAALLQDPAMLQVNIAAMFLNIIYIGFFYVYAVDRKAELYKPASYATVFVAIILGYAELESPELLEFRYGLLVTVLMLALVGSPLKDVKEIIRKKDSSSILFPLTFMGTIVSFLWLLYGIILDNVFMVFQNAVGFTLCAVQLYLVYLYPSPQTKKSRVD